MMLLARSDQDALVSARTLAGELDASEAHLGKVLHQLTKSGLLRARRGPHGGFRLRRPANEVTLLNVYEAIEGPLSTATCLLGRPRCDGRSCVLGGLLESVQHTVRNHLQSKRLSDFRSAHVSPILGAAETSPLSMEVRT
jgi:Rrf2 family protein